MRRPAILLFTMLLVEPARAYTIYSIEASELHRHQMHAMRALLLDAREFSAADFTAWVGDPGGGGDAFAAGVAARWHRTLSSGNGYGFAFETHGSTVGAWLLQGHFSRNLVTGDRGAIGATAAFGYQRLEGGYALSCEDRFGGYSQLPVEKLDYVMLGAALHGERRFGWLRFGLDLVFTQARPDLVEGEIPFGSGEPCPGDHEEVQNELRLGAGIGIGGEELEAYAGVVSSMMVLRLRYRF